MMIGRFFAPAVGWMVVMAALALMGGFSMADSPTELIKADHGKVITVAKGDLLQVELETLGAAGYAWHIESLDPEYWETTLTDAVLDSRKGSSIGGPTLHTWQFRAIRAGETEIVMLNYRVWEGKNKAIDEFRVKVKIRTQER